MEKSKTLLSGVVYKFSCGGCNATYIDKTKRHFKKRVSEHMGVSALTGKVLKGQQSTAVRDHMLDCNHVVNHDDFILMTRDNSDYLLQIKESLFIGRDDPSLNKTIQGLTNPCTCVRTYTEIRNFTSTYIVKKFSERRRTAL